LTLNEPSEKSEGFQASLTADERQGYLMLTLIETKTFKIF
jgi:hypothetical protein